MSADNQIFHFKQFDVANRRSAMKVNTDGVLLGAWCEALGSRCVWDVGCGTGVIALMMAQRCPEAQVFGIEIDAAAAREATSNFAQSPWAERLHLTAGDIMEVYSTLTMPDLIVCNPPYFITEKHGLVSPQQRKSAVRHEGTLSYRRLIELAAEVLSPKGRLCMVSPADRCDDIELQAALSGLDVERRILVHTNPHKPAKRVLWSLTRGSRSLPEVGTLCIRSALNEYTPEYLALVGDFYTHL